MRLIIVLIIFVLCQTSVSARAYRNCGRRYAGRGLSVGGTKVDDISKWPWVVAFTHNAGNNYFCGGSLLSTHHVLSGRLFKTFLNGTKLI